MSSTVFSYDEFRREIEHFARELPVALARNSLTADLVQRLTDLLRFDERLFTVAVIGQMRVGKSSLLNALVDREDLAITGVEETTATINWFKYGEGEQTKNFRVTWKDSAAEEFSREEIREWIGRSEQAARAAFIELFADAPFLKKANLVDTPGTRSAIESHEDATQDFLDLASRLEEETLHQGSRADAIVYVFPPVARESDEELLARFGDETRVSGSSAYNSIGVLHKWDGLNVDDPVVHAREKAGGLSRLMREKVSTVLPVSAPLHLASLWGEGFWKTLHKIAVETKTEDLGRLLKMEKRFRGTEVPSCPITPDQRSKFRENFQLPWATLRLLFKMCAKESFTSPDEFRQWSRKAGGVDRLREELERRFFSRSRMIRSLGVLNKVAGPCYTAVTRLENKKGELDKDIHALPALLKSIEKVDIPSLEPVKSYIERAEADVNRRFSKLVQDHRSIDSLRTRASEICNEMSGDADALEHLEDPAHSQAIPTDLVWKIRQLLGANGSELENRIDGLAGEGCEFTRKECEDLIENLLKASQSFPDSVASLVERAIERLEQIYEKLE